VPLGGEVYPGADGLPVTAYDTQLDPARAGAHAGFGAIFCVACPELFVVLLALLATTMTVSALAVNKKLLATTSSANFFSTDPPLKAQYFQRFAT